MVSKEILEEIRSRICIVSLIGGRVPLKKSGRHFKGLCPFHQEKTPSFMVSEEKQMFHCFGCSEGGDIFTFLMKLDGLTFPEALEDLAKQAGVELPAPQQGDNRSKDSEWARRKAWGYRLNELAMAHFIKTLSSPQGTTAKNYLKSRGIAEETSKTFLLGYAGPEWEGLVEMLQAAGAPIKLAAELGLVKKREKREGYFDFFRDRLIFPILDGKGNIVGFGGRTLSKEESAKYLNSSESFLYRKSNLVYGFPQAKESIRQKEEIVLVEGYTDMISLWQAGEQNVVAPLGTALTTEQIRLLMRFSHNFIVAFDGDDAGTKAALRSLSLFLELELTPKALALPHGFDPDSFIRQEGLEKWNRLKAKAPTLFEYFIQITVRQSGAGTADKLNAWRQIKPLLAQVRNKVEQKIYLRQTAEQLGLEEAALKATPFFFQKPKQPLTPSKSPLETYPEEERLLLAALLLAPETIDIVRQNRHVITHPELKKIFTQLFEKSADERSVALTDLVRKWDRHLAVWIREMALVEEEEGNWKKVANDCLVKIKKRNLEKELDQLNRQIKEAEKNGDESALLKLLSEKSSLMEIKKGLVL